MSRNPIYTVTPLDDVPHAVRIETMVPPSTFYDESLPIVLQATAPEALPLMQAFLSGLSLNVSWTNRENRGALTRKESRLPDGTPVFLVECSFRARLPSVWYRVAVSEHLDLQLDVHDKLLATQLFEAMCAGTLELRFADPDPVQP